jgi:hypothetical protein
MPLPSLPRVLGAATAAYSLTALARPAVFARPCGLVDADGSVPPGVATAIRAVSARDVAASVAMVVAPVGPALDTAIALRAAADLSDAVVFGLLARDPAVRTKVLAVTVTWGALTLLSKRFAQA